MASAQIKSAVLLAGLAAPGVTTVIETEASRDHTELMLKHFGAQIVSTREGSHGRKIALTGQPELHGAEVVVPADPSSAAFPIVAALIVEGSDIVLSDVMTNPLRTGLFTTLREMGASIEESHVRGDAGEPMAQLRVRASKLRGVEVPPERAPSMIDEYLVLAVAAGFAEGTTIMRGLQELRVKESDRLEATAADAAGQRRQGRDLRRRHDRRGQAAMSPGGGLVATHMDHRIAMSALVMGLASDKPVKVDDTAFIATSFPDFIPMMRSLGAEFSHSTSVHLPIAPSIIWNLGRFRETAFRRTCGFGSIGRIFAGIEAEGVRITDPIRGETERLDILNLMQVVGISTAEDAIALLGRYFPVSAASSEKQRFLLKNMNREGGVDAPKYPR